jgi:hypothetical protein
MTRPKGVDREFGHLGEERSGIDPDNNSLDRDGHDI